MRQDLVDYCDDPRLIPSTSGSRPKAVHAGSTLDPRRSVGQLAEVVVLGQISKRVQRAGHALSPAMEMMERLEGPVNRVLGVFGEVVHAP